MKNQLTKNDLSDEAQALDVGKDIQKKEILNEADKSADYELFNVQDIDDFDDESFNLDEEANNNDPKSNEKVFEDIEKYRKQLSADGDDLENYQFEDNRSEIKEPANEVDVENENIKKSDIKIDDDGIFYGKDYYEAEDDTMSKEVFADNENDQADDDALKKLHNSTNLENGDIQNESQNHAIVDKDNDTMSNEKAIVNDQKENQQSEVVDKDDTLSNENVNNDEEKNNNDSDAETMSKEVIQNDPNYSQNSEIVDEHDDTMSKENINNDKKTNDGHIGLVLDNDDDGQKDINESDNYDDYNDGAVEEAEADLNEDLKKLFETWDNLSGLSDGNFTVIEYEEYDGKPFKPIKNYEDVDDEPIEDEDSDELENIDSNLADIFKEAVSADDQNLQDDVDAIFKLLAQKSTNLSANDEDENLQSVVDKSKEDVDSNLQTVNVTAKQETEVTSKEYDVLMEGFKANHEEELDPNSEKFTYNIVPIRITLRVDEAEEIELINYSANNVIDWILEGDGVGVECNVTFLNLRGAQSDYLLIIPGK